MRPNLGIRALIATVALVTPFAITTCDSRGTEWGVSG
jgi:hypothetical protein